MVPMGWEDQSALPPFETIDLVAPSQKHYCTQAQMGAVSSENIPLDHKREVDLHVQ